ncbi:hypothetical protein GCM10025863_15850 [Microbacterium suwonense]|uniref:Uncharacterized protein n=2 Tax=Microbacterium suwonense TaxID=683047 RepID=A0ABM8FTW2_9MICO|nr:hypothetical protein GCM10025863_15850 [Microbacterium suwonense]
MAVAQPRDLHDRDREVCEQVERETGGGDEREPGCAGSAAKPARASAPIIEKPPARPTACHRSSAMIGVRMGQDALESATGTGQASAMATAPSTPAAAMTTPCGITSAPVSAASASDTSMG